MGNRHDQTENEAKWIEEGDRNTRFYHALLRDRRRRNTISLTQMDGTILTDASQIGDLVAQYYHELFTASPYRMHEDLFADYPCTVTADVNCKLTQIPEHDEIRAAVWALSPDSAPGPDGFTGHFFQSCWDTIKADIIQMIQGFFQGDHLDKKITATTLTLIPKIEKPRGFHDFRPISLATFTNKIISKIIASTLGDFLPQLIDEEHYGFVKCRNIHESIALAQELVAEFDRKVEKGNMVIKFDMSKAYDRLEWRFLLRALWAMGFSNGFQDLIFKNISDIYNAININGDLSRMFHSTRGLR